jgi:uroporphyrinogen-III synthase
MSSQNLRPLIFSTRCLPENLQVMLSEAGFDFQEKDFIQVEHRFIEEAFRERLLHSDSQARVFTSKNAVRSLKMLLEANAEITIPAKKLFTVGIKATEMLVKFGLKANVRADNAIVLAQIIARNSDVKEIDFYCGDKALDDLPEYLRSKNIKVNKEVVYHTELVHEEVDCSAFSGVIFLSPTAALSFFKKNQISPKIPAFCIGATTSEAVRMRCENPRICAKDPTLEGVIKKIIEHFA